MAETETFGLELYMGNGASSEAFFKVFGITDISEIPGYARTEIDTTSIEDTVNQFLAGRADPGSFSANVMLDYDNSSHDDLTGLILKAKTKGLTNWALKIPLSDNVSVKWLRFSGPLLRLVPSASTNDVIRASLSIRVSGDWTITNVAPTIDLLPPAFAAANWTWVDADTTDDVNLNIVSLPTLPSGTSTPTAIEYRLNGGAPVTLSGGYTTGSRSITSTTAVPVTAQIRSVNAVGRSAWSDVKTATPTAP